MGACTRYHLLALKNSLHVPRDFFTRIHADQLERNKEDDVEEENRRYWSCLNRVGDKGAGMFVSLMQCCGATRSE